MKCQAIIFPCAKLTLHGVRYVPDNDGIYPGVIVCHPHSLYGGSMDNIIVKRLAAALTDKDIISLIFNFRGLGQSQGNFDDGIGEQDDITAAIDWLVLQPDIDKDRIGLAGYSFGGGVSIPVACNDIRVKTFALISPVITDYTIEILNECNKPKLFVVGEKDDVTLPSIIEETYNNAAEPKQYKSVPHADHFWYGYENILVDLTATFLANGLKNK